VLQPGEFVTSETPAGIFLAPVPLPFLLAAIPVCFVLACACFTTCLQGTGLSAPIGSTPIAGMSAAQTLGLVPAGGVALVAGVRDIFVLWQRRRVIARARVCVCRLALCCRQVQVVSTPLDR
jgi:hypothetical protein